jgi:hypothetical protein
MTQTHKLIVVDPKAGQLSSPVAQRLAFSFGYKWTSVYCLNHPTGVLDIGPTRVLIFDTDKKEISYLVRMAKYEDAVQVNTADGLIDALTNPVLDTKTIDSDNGNVNATIFDDTVTFRSKTSRVLGTVTVPKDLVTKVMREVVPVNKGLPVVFFDYNGKTRYVRVTRQDADYVQGFELKGSTDCEKGTYKKYSMNNITGDVCLYTFIQS